MVTKKLKELYNVDTISQDKGWKKVREAIEEIKKQTSDTILIDFSATNVVDPWQSPEFKELLKDKQIHMKFVNSKDVVGRIKIICLMEGIQEDKIQNIEIEVPREKTAEERSIEEKGLNLIKYFKDDGTGTYIFNVGEKYSQIQNTGTINYIKFAMDKLIEDGVKKLRIKFDKVTVLTNVLRVLANIMVEYRHKGVRLDIDIDDIDSCKELELFLHSLTNENYTEQDRLVEFKKLKVNTAGMLVRYKKSKAIDDFGRQGKGEVVSSRIAIYKGIKQSKKGIVAVFDTYNNNYFYTRQHWMIEHDNEELDKLHIDTIELNMNEIGLYDYFLGRNAHFVEPIQNNIKESRMLILDIDEQGRNLKKLCTVPERMKIVFDDWGIEYDKDALDRAIRSTVTKLLDNAKK